MKFFIQISLLLLISGPLVGQNLQNLTLIEAIQMALQNKPRLKSFELKSQIEASKTEVLKLQRQPVVSGQLDVQLNPVLQTSVIPVGVFNPALGSDATASVRFGTLWQNSAGIQVSQSLYDPSITAQIREQEFQQQFIAADREKTTEEITLEVVKAYYAISIAMEELVFATADSIRASLLYEQTRTRLEGGKVLQNELNATLMSLNAASLALNRSRFNGQLLLKNLCYTIGISPDRSTEIRLADDLNSFLEQARAQGLAKYDATAVEQTRPELRQLYLDSEWQNLKIRTAQTLTAPTLSAIGYAGANNLSDDAPFFTESSWFGNVFVGLKLSVPISEYWQEQKREAPYRLKQQQNVIDVLELKQRFQNDFENARLNFELASQTMIVRLQDLELSKQNVELVRERFNEGMVLPSNMLDEETAVQQIQYNYLRSAYDLLLAALEIQRTLGNLSFR